MLAGCTQDICSALPTADSHLDHPNTSGSEALPWVAQGQGLKRLDGTGSFFHGVATQPPLVWGGRARASLRAAGTCP